MRHLLVTYPYTEVMTFSLWKVKINFFESYRYSELLKWNNTVTCVITWDKDVSLLKTLLVYTNTHEHFVWDNVNQTLHTINLRVQLVRKGTYISDEWHTKERQLLIEDMRVTWDTVHYVEVTGDLMNEWLSIVHAAL